MENKIRVCIFDDNHKLRDAVALLLSFSDNINLVGSYADAKNLKDKMSCNPDVVLMDIDMPQLNGIDAVKEVKKLKPDVQVLMFTVFENDDKIFQSICNGASGYLLKNTEPQKIIDSINEVVAGGAPMSPIIARKVLGNLKLSSSESKKTDYHLSAREIEVLSHLVNGLSYKMIADKCNISYETVRSHIKNIYEKLHVVSMTSAVAKAINEKLI